MPPAVNLRYRGLDTSLRLPDTSTQGGKRRTYFGDTTTGSLKCFILSLLCSVIQPTGALSRRTAALSWEFALKRRSNLKSERVARRRS